MWFGRRGGWCECGAPETEEAHTHCWDEILSTCWHSQVTLPFPGKPPGCKVDLDLGLQQWWGLPTAMGRASVVLGI